ncbi:MAG: PaaI family thioesterase [Deltaproteobacteria bacterium]|nr:PaaI family thioesterase [Deltaproteobacteria bacterium]
MQIIRNVQPGEYRITDIFPDIWMSNALMEIFGTPEAVENILANHKVNVMDRRYYMAVSNEDGTIFISLHHLQTSPEEILHLDIIHELVHVRQHKQGLDLFDRTVSYADSRTEIEAYAITVKEARRLGFTEDQIFRYLQVEWCTPGEQKRLARHLNVPVGPDCEFIMDYEVYVRRLKTGNPINPFLQFLGAVPEEIGEGYARFRLPVRDEFKQINGHVQDGLIGALAVETIAHAVMTSLKANECMTCVETKNAHPAVAIDGDLFSEATAFKKEGSQIGGECIVRAESGTIVCRTAATFFIRNEAGGRL